MPHCLWSVQFRQLDAFNCQSIGPPSLRTDLPAGQRAAPRVKPRAQKYSYFQKFGFGV